MLDDKERRLTMRRTLCWLLVALLSIGLLYGTFAWADEGKKEAKKEKIALDKAPKLVQETILKEAGENEVKEIVKITRGDKTVYEAEWKEKGKSVEIVVSPDGKIVSVTKQIAIDDVPKAVKETILKEAGSNTIKDVEVITKGDKTTYKTGWVDNGKKVDLRVAPDGKVISKKSEEAKEKKKTIALDKAPKPVQETVLKEAGKNEVKEIVKITKGDKTVYEAEWKEKDKSVEILVSPDGKIVSVTKQTAIDDVPKVVKETMLKEAGGNTIEDVEVITEGDKTTYEAEWTDNGKEVDLKVAPDGKVITKNTGESEEKEKGNKEEKENEKEEKEH